VRAVADPQLSPDGRTVLYAVRTTDVEANRRATRTFVVPSAGGAPRAWPDSATPATEARWSPDGRRVAYVSGGQLWVADADGANRRQVTRLNGGAGGPVWGPSGDVVLVTSAVWPACTGAAMPNGFDDGCNARKDSAKAASKVQAHVADRLMYRHWNAWDEGTRQHLFAVTLGAGEPAVRDLVPGARTTCPPGPFGGSEGYAVSPDGREVAFTAKLPTRDEAWSTNVEVWTVPRPGGAAPALVTRGMPGADQNPVYTPDGRAIVFASQRRAGFESDRWRLMRYDRASRQIRELLRPGTATPTRTPSRPATRAPSSSRRSTRARQALPRRARRRRPRRGRAGARRRHAQQRRRERVARRPHGRLAARRHAGAGRGLRRRRSTAHPALR
jgi:hypothetical protein